MESSCIASRLLFQVTFVPLALGLRRERERDRKGSGISNGYAHLYPGLRWIIINVKVEIPAE